MDTSPRHWPRVRAAATTAVAAVVIGGCAGDEQSSSAAGDDGTATTTTTTTTTSTAPEPASSVPSTTSAGTASPTVAPRETTPSTVAATARPEPVSTMRVIVTLVDDVDVEQAAHELTEAIGDHGTITRIFEFTGQLLAEVDETGRSRLEGHPTVRAVDDDGADPPDG